MKSPSCTPAQHVIVELGEDSVHRGGREASHGKRIDELPSAVGVCRTLATNSQERERSSEALASAEIENDAQTRVESSTCCEGSNARRQEMHYSRRPIENV